MICPNCKRNTDDSKDYCDYCGIALFGPRSISLDTPQENSASHNTNIENITGIDIDSIKKEESKPVPEKKFKIDINFIKKNHKFILIVIGGILLILSIILMIVNITKCSCSKCEDSSKELLKVKNYYLGYANNYEFELPNNWIFESNSSLLFSNKDKIQMVIHPSLNASVYSSNDTAILEKYNEDNYSDLNIETKTLNNKKIIYVKYKYNNMNALDFYYFYDSNNLIYGNIFSKIQSNLLNEENKNIISSLKITSNNNVISSSSDFNINGIFN